MSASNQNPNDDFGFASLADLVAHQYEAAPELPAAPARRSSVQAAKETVVRALRRSAAISTRSLGLDR